MMIIVECFKDQQLMFRMGFIPDQMGHERGRSRVLAKLEQEKRAVGIIDEDPQAGQPPDLRKYKQKKIVGKISLLIGEDDDGKGVIRRAIQISPRLEDWLYTIASRNKVSPKTFSLPENPGELHKRSLKGDKDYRRFLEELIKKKDDEISTMTKWIWEAITE